MWNIIFSIPCYLNFSLFKYNNVRIEKTLWLFHQLKVLDIDCGCLCICEKFNRHFSNLSYQRYIIQLIKKKITITFAKIFFKFLKITFLTNTLLLFTIKTNNTFPSPTNFKFSHQFRINPYSISKDLTAPEKISLEKKEDRKFITRYCQYISTRFVFRRSPVFIDCC